MIKGVIFDIDGVILDSMPIWNKAGEMYLRKLGLQPNPGLSKAMESMSMHEGAKFLKEKYHLDMNEDEIVKGINKTIEDFYAYEVRLKEGVEKFLEGLKERKIKIVAATSCDREVFEKALVRLNVIRYFEKIFTSTETGSGKTKPDIFLAAADYMGTRPCETWVFEDALYAIKTAKDAGFRTVGVYDYYNSDKWDEIKNTCDICFEKLDDVNVFLEKALASEL
ncbi:hypothetical protein Cst_c18400 [Thermoclostridium stercorarium subsp. stercorarium DSM 8532]|uniref:Phosphatase n=3 Tax=Thermoclostridium stercorarium TaxID=1510 RepID=L7VPT7_THES1|nr:HAD family phosphatase [Thermoclostridium stercorarium]AGC68817.1 hypothetical protein Cst_c18400 [Thermoclostridium stercorarium subsp. stercorarium DSM 8532]AGI39817.1 haloacid dehalogenase [Thermoclostridium stercorarium subsp. stercorarium DSM 8532]ANW99126.1 phosphatase [Thermoclostridium stercorarium subsp. thermolacticum DSM 2910]ANX01690.1 phosphatase [Thermoclostridium stercorarium subsp. leptospartum DSM 9219]UZQ84811.1 HAD family phosphatase [Thermoclostridium stercorarium]